MDSRFDDRADVWDAYTRSPGGRLRRELILRNLSAHRPALEGVRVLDAAGGVGDIALELLGTGCQVTLLDISAKMLKLAAARASSAGLDKLTCVHADVTAVAGLFSPASFDLILVHSLLEFLSNPAELLKSLAHLLAPDGMLSLVFGNRNHFPLRYALKELDAGRALESLSAGDVAGVDLFGLERLVFDPGAVQEMVAETGLRIVGVYGVRVFADLVPGDLPEGAQWLDLEAAAGAHPAFWPIARFIQIIAVN